LKDHDAELIEGKSRNETNMSVTQAEAYKGLRRDWLGKVGFMPDDGEIQESVTA